MAAYNYGTGAIVGRFNYDLFGKRFIVNADGTLATNQNDDFGVSYGYTSRRHDAESELMYFRARYYDSATGEFISQDPLSYIDGMSMYRGYMTPNSTDPSGRSTVQDDACGGGCVANPDFETSMNIFCHTPDCKDFESTSCEHGCECADTMAGENDSGRKKCAKLLKAAKKAVLEIGGGNLKLGKFYCSTKCGGTDYGLTCWRDVGGKLEVGVCIPTGRQSTACEVEALIAHEITHVKDIFKHVQENGGVQGIDRDEFEKRAYENQCSVYADQQCLTPGQREGFIRSCIDKLIGQSTKPENVQEIEGGCKKFEW